MKAIFYAQSPTRELFKIMEAEIKNPLPDMFFPLPDVVGLRRSQNPNITPEVSVTRQAHFVKLNHAYTEEILYLLKEEI